MGAQGPDDVKGPLTTDNFEELGDGAKRSLFTHAVFQFHEVDVVTKWYLLYFGYPHTDIAAAVIRNHPVAVFLARLPTFPPTGDPSQ